MFQGSWREELKSRSSDSAPRVALLSRSLYPSEALCCPGRDAPSRGYGQPEVGVKVSEACVWIEPHVHAPRPLTPWSRTVSLPYSHLQKAGSKIRSKGVRGPEPEENPGDKHPARRWAPQGWVSEWGASSVWKALWSSDSGDKQMKIKNPGVPRDDHTKEVRQRQTNTWYRYCVES